MKPTYLERQKQRSEANLHRQQQQSQEVQKVNDALTMLWLNPSFQILLITLDDYFDPEKALLKDEHFRHLTTIYWAKRREMEHKYGTDHRQAAG